MNISHQHCINCGHEKFVNLSGYEGENLVRCNSCFLVFCRNVPTNDDLKRHYLNYPRQEQLSDLTKKRYEKLLDIFEKYRSTGNLIDLGCSNGLFLQCAKERGWKVFGTEFDSTCIEYNAKNGIKVFRSDQLPEELFQLRFDIVTSFEVFEHLNDPNREMGLIDSLLRKRGLLYITTPNFNSISRHYLKQKWNIIEYPEHLTYFTPHTLNKTVMKFGYENIKMQTTGFSFSRFSKSSENSESIVSSINDEELRNKIEKSGLLNRLKSMINFFLTVFYVGDAMKAFYIKK